MIVESIFDGIISTSKNFASFPGLKLWIDPKTGTVLEGSGVSKASDLSLSGNDLTNTATGQRPILETVSGYTTIRISYGKKLLAPGLEAFKFLHDGSKYGVFTVVRVNNTYDGANNYILGTALNSSGGDRGIALRHNDTSPNVNKIGFSTSKGSGGFAINYVTADNSLALDTPGLINVNYYGSGATGNDSILSVGNTVVGGGETTNPLSTAGQSLNFSIGQISSVPGDCNFFLVLVYNWTGQTDSNINSYTTEIKALINAEFSALSL